MSNLKSDVNSMPRTDIELKPDKSVAEEDIYDEPRKLRCDVNYSVCREILNTERTHLKVQYAPFLLISATCLQKTGSESL
jgi:hypothetical protein